MLLHDERGLGRSRFDVGQPQRSWQHSEFRLETLAGLSSDRARVEYAVLLPLEFMIGSCMGVRWKETSTPQDKGAHARISFGRQGRRCVFVGRADYDDIGVVSVNTTQVSSCRVVEKMLF